MFKFITNRPLWLNILTGLLLALIIFFIFIFSLKWLTHHDEAKTVPSVIGKTFTEAKDILEKAGFDVEIQDSIYVDTLKPMRVIKQVPEDGEVVKINRTVYLTINRAVPPSVEMPSLNGFSYRSAAMQLQNMGIKVDTVYRSNFARDAVLEVLYNGEPLTAGTKLRMGDRVKLVLGSGVGTEKFTVPTLVGLTYCQAKSWIEAHGISIGSIIIPPGTKITDTCNAYIFQQNPVRFDDEKKLQYIHTGQTIDVWLQIDKPAPDSLAVPLQPLQQQ